MMPYVTGARNQGKSIISLNVVEHCMITGKSLAIGTDNVDRLYGIIKEKFPDAKLSKGDGYVYVNQKIF